MYKQSTLLILLTELNENTLKYTVIDTPGLKNHIMSRDSNFRYDKLEQGKTYVIRCSYVDNVWRWDLAIPIDLGKAIK